MPRLFAGIDGGGTKTAAVVVDADGVERGRAVAGSSNFAAVGPAAALHEIRVALGGAVELAGGALPVAGVWIGLAGIGRPGDGDMLLPELSRMADVVQLTNDAELLLSAWGTSPGVGLIAGTGSIALARDAAGQIHRAGGWGHIIGDEGSGYDLGRQALQAASHAADGRGPETALLAAILDRWQLVDPSGMITQVYLNGDKATIAELSSLVFGCAAEGDRVARRIVARGATGLSEIAIAAANALGSSPAAVPLALGGGLMLHNAGYRAMVLRRIRRRRPLASVALVEDPALSAARAAVALMRQPVAAQVHDTLS